MNNEDKLVISKAEDTIYLSQKRFSPVFYGFLNEHETQIIKDNVYLDDSCVFWGGFSDSLRVIFGAGVNNTDDFPITTLKFSFKKEYELSHRDFLGALMSLGIERSTIGDIIVNKGEAVIFVKYDIADFITEQVDKIGRVGVSVCIYDGANFTHEYNFDELSFTLSSLRLDAFVANVCKLSREKAQALINNDFVCVNHRVENSNCKNLAVNDIVTIRKYGKYVFAEECGFSKKGKIRISVKHFR